MYGMPARANEPDLYRNRKSLKRLDLAAGFFVALLVWALLFHPYWFVAPAIIAAISGLALIKQFKRRYIAYGALSCIFFPVLVMGFGMIWGHAFGD